MLKIKPGFGARVAMVRKDSGMSKLAFARLALSDGASSKNMGRIEAEEVTPRPMTLAKIAVFGGVSMEWLTQGQMALLPNDICRTGGVGQRIREVREAAGMTRCELSRISGLGNTTKNIDRLEVREHTPRARTLVKIARALNVSPTYLAYGQ